MAIRFIHAADLHLGYQQYNHPERYNDFGRAFERLVDDALAREVDFVLLAGDLFHKRTIEPRTLLQASYQLHRLHRAGIPVFAVEGNHDRAHYSEALSWLGYLAEEDLLFLLDIFYQDGKPHLIPWNPEAKAGSYVDLPAGIRILGLKYYGASTPRVVRDLAQALANITPAPYTILMMHAGLEGILDYYAGTLSRAQLEELRPYVNYLALGHIHKPFTQDDWIYNPGSLETYSITEANWPERGYFVVEVDISQGTHQVSQICPPRRPFLILSFPVDRLESPETLYRALKSYLEEQASKNTWTQPPVIELRLTGILAFEHADLDLSQIKLLVEEALHPLLCNVKDTSSANTFEVRVSHMANRQEIERCVLQELLERDARYQAQSAHWARAALRLKE
ncbi:MAG: exonuclease SbcCD subunit D, partial [Anaerolineae bacterium]|nr:exonuclease SbcCD subunit D [Anaerolineae bacterium]